MITNETVPCGQAGACQYCTPPCQHDCRHPVDVPVHAEDEIDTWVHMGKWVAVFFLVFIAVCVLLGIFDADLRAFYWQTMLLGRGV